jgi:hypothetical protein
MADFSLKHTSAIREVLEYGCSTIKSTLKIVICLKKIGSGSGMTRRSGSGINHFRIHINVRIAPLIVEDFGFIEFNVQ